MDSTCRLLSRAFHRHARPCLVAALLLASATTSTAALADVTSGVSDERVSLPDGPGSIGGLGANATVDANHGAMRYSVTIEAPRGFAGLTPSLDLQYSSTGGTGPLGIGWSMSIPSIDRMTSRGLPSYAESDLFAADGGDELVQVAKSGVNATYRARFEKSFIRYVWHGVGAAGYWTAEMPDGRMSYYGAQPDGTLVGSAQVKTAAGGVFRYMLTATVDSFGNKLTYSYQKTSGGYPLLDEIDYLFTGDGKPRFSVRYAYENRDDLISDGSPGFELVLDKRLSEVRVRSGAAEIRRASLEYESSVQSGGASRLAGVEQFGLNDVPDPIHFTFGYTQGLGSCGAGCTKPQMVDMGTLPGNVLLNVGKASMVDINGDSLPDILATDPLTGKHTFFVAKMSADGTPVFEMTPKESAKGSSSLVLGLPAVQLMDVNGDGFTDIVNAKTHDFRCNDGSGDWSTSTFCLGASGGGDMFSDGFSPADDPGDTGQDPLHVRFFDFDHDRKIDWLRTESQGSTVVSRNTGMGFEAVTVAAIGEVFDESPLQLADMNGDGLQDPVEVLTAGSVRYRINLGFGKWADWREVSLKGLDPSQLGSARIEDINGDGLHDIVVVGGNEIRYLLNRNGDHFDAPVVIGAGDVQGQLPSFDPLTTSVSFADMNGNGSNDIVWVTNTGSVKFLELFPLRPNLITRIENGVGHVQVFTYGSSVAEQARDAAAGTPWKYRLPHAMTVVTSSDSWVTLTGSDSGGLHEITKYRYGHGYYDGKEAQFKGYERTETERVGEAATDSQDPGLTVQTTDVGATDIYRSGLPLISQSYSLAGGQKALLREDRKEYADCPLSDVPSSGLTKPARFVCEKASLSVLVEGDLASAVTTREERAYDGYGNVTLDSKLGVIHRGTPESPLACEPCAAGAPFGQICGATCQGDELFTETSYVVPGGNSGGAWQLNRPWRETRRGVSGGPVQETLTFYDGEPFVGAPQGTLTKGFVSRVMKRTGQGPNDFLASVRNKADVHGNVLETFDPLGSPSNSSSHHKIYTYDAVGHQVLGVEVLLTDPKGSPISLRREVTYDPTWDKISEGTAWMLVEGGEVKSPRNSKKYRYDPLGRMIKLLEPGDVEETPTREVAYDFSAVRIRMIDRGRSQPAGGADIETVTCHDGQGRLYQTRTLLSGDSYQVSGFTEFNKKGNPVRKYQPFVGSSSECDLAPPSGVPFESLRYDALDRQTDTIHPDGSVRTVAFLPLGEALYDENDTDSSGPFANTPTIQRKDGQGRLVAIERYLGPSTPSVTRFEYDSLGRMTAYVDAKGHRHEQSYDALDRVVQIHDPSAGVVSIEYDDVGNVVRRTDARGVSVRRAYDGVNRPVAVWDEANEAGTIFRTSYDKVEGCAECQNGANLPASIEMPLGQSALSARGSIRFGYDARGREVFEQHTVEGHDFVLRHEYDGMGRKLKSTFPDGQTVAWQHDASSRVIAMPGVLGKISYDDRGQMTGLSYANGAKAEMGYDQRMRPVMFRTSSASGQVLHGEELTRDAVGNVLAIADTAAAREGRPSQRLSAKYDAWYRLTEASIDEGGPQAEKLSFTFDETERILSAVSSLGPESPAHVGELTYGNDQPLSVHVGGATYDASGALASRSGLSLERDMFGRLSAVSESGEVRASYAYETPLTGVRELALEDGGATYVIGDSFEVRDGVSVVYARLGTKRLSRTMSDKMAPALLSDLAPASGTGNTFTPEGDGHIDAADAWLAQAASAGVVQLSGGPAPSPVSRLLRASARRMLMEDGEAQASLHHDHLGSVVLSSDDKGELVAEQGYYPFGQLRGQRGFVDRYGFTGQELDTITGLLHFKYREYDPRTGRWTQVDPAFLESSPRLFLSGTMADAMSAYGYVGNSPLSNVDPLGLNGLKDVAEACLSCAKKALDVTVNVVGGGVKGAVSGAVGGLVVGGPPGLVAGAVGGAVVGATKAAAHEVVNALPNGARQAVNRVAQGAELAHAAVELAHNPVGAVVSHVVDAGVNRAVKPASSPRAAASKAHPKN
jgi:RHS repeat-associated protein